MTFLLKFCVLPAVMVGLYLVTAATIDPGRSHGETGCALVASVSMRLDVREALASIKCRLTT